MELSITTAVWLFVCVMSVIAGFKMLLVGIDILRTDKTVFQANRKRAGTLKQQLVGEMPNGGYSSEGVRDQAYARGLAINKVTGHFRIIGRTSDDALKGNLR